MKNSFTRPFPDAAMITAAASRSDARSQTISPMDWLSVSYATISAVYRSPAASMVGKMACARYRSASARHCASCSTGSRGSDRYVSGPRSIDDVLEVCLRLGGGYVRGGAGPGQARRLHRWGTRLFGVGQVGDEVVEPGVDCGLVSPESQSWTFVFGFGFSEMGEGDGGCRAFPRGRRRVAVGGGGGAHLGMTWRMLTWSPSLQKLASAQSTMYSDCAVPSTGRST